MSPGVQTAERIYYDEPGVTEFTGHVTAIREVARVDGRQVWQIALDRTAFYPTSGGQPHDTGKLTATARSGASLDVPVTQVEEDEDGEVWHTTHKPLQEGTLVRGMVDVARRRDHMQQHSGQHLLSAILLREFHARTVSFHLGAETSTIDLDAPSLDEEHLEQAERAANHVIRQVLPVSIRYVSQGEAEEMLAAGLLRKLPPRAGRIRLIEIAGLDLNACGGTHVVNTADIGPLLLRSTERVRGGLRLSFICGDRAIMAARHDLTRLASLARSLSTGVDEVADAIARLQTEAKAAAKERSALLQSLAEADAERVAADAIRGGRHFVVHALDTQQPGRDAGFAKRAASHAIAGSALLAAVFVAPENARASIALAAKPGTLDAGSLLRAALDRYGSKGGGSRELAQGSVSMEQIASVLDDLRQELAGATRATP